MDAQVIAGRYRLERQLGLGGMSEVWAAEDTELDRTVAVKLLARDADPARFEREARAAAGLSHPNICALYDYGEDEGRRYMVLEYLPGGTLEDRLAAGEPLPDAETQRIAREMAAGLAHAHERGLVHRDLKPSNVLFDGEGRVKIADFGIAHVEAATGLTEAGTVLGTAAYISPEQASGQQATPASDVYSFGVILFRMLAGRLPFEAPDALALAAMHRDLPPPSVAEFRADAPPLLESLAAASLAKGPRDRPADGRALLAELGLVTPPPTGPATALTQVIAPAAEGAAPPPPRRRPRRRLAIALIALVALAAAGVGLAMGLGSSGNAPAVVSTTSRPSTTKRHTTSAAPTSAPVFTGSAPTTSSTAATSTTSSTTSTAQATTLPAPTTAPSTSTHPQPVTTLPTTTSAPPPPTFTDTVPTSSTTLTDTTPTTTAATTPATTAAASAGPMTTQVTTTG